MTARVGPRCWPFSKAKAKNRPISSPNRAGEDTVREVIFPAAKALGPRHDREGRAALLAVLEGESKTSSNFFSKQKREALRMMHTPRTTFLFAVQQGAGFIPFPGVGEGVASMQGILRSSGARGRASAALLLGPEKAPELARMPCIEATPSP